MQFNKYTHKHTHTHTMSYREENRAPKRKKPRCIEINRDGGGDEDGDEGGNGYEGWTGNSPRDSKG